MDNNQLSTVRTRIELFFTFAMALAMVLVMSGCATIGLTGASQKQSIMDEATREHPATQAFLEFMADAEQTNNYELMLDKHYTAATKTRILATKGWYRLAYSSAFQFVKEGQCRSITLDVIHTRKAKINCMGEMMARSIYIGDNLEPAHLQVDLVKVKDQWYLERAGYIHLQTNVSPVGFKRAGLTFASPLDDPDAYLAEQ